MSALLRKYGQSATFTIPLPKSGTSDFAGSADWSPAPGDVRISRDGGDLSNIATLPTPIGGAGAILWEFALSAAEMQAAHIAVQIATDGLQHQAVLIETYGDAAAQHPFDLGTETPAGTAAVRDLLEADRYIDTNQTPWQLVLIKQGTGGLGVGTELLRQELRDVNGVAVTSTDTVLGQSITP